MATTRRAQILMEPKEYEILVRIARERGVSFSELMRLAARECYLSAPAGGKDVVEAICGMELDLPSWHDLETEITEGHYAPLP